MIAVILSLGLATAALFLVNFYFPTINNIKKELLEKDIDISHIQQYNSFYTFLFVVFSTIFNTLAFWATAPAMIFAHKAFIKSFEESIRTRVMSQVNESV